MVWVDSLRGRLSAAALAASLAALAFVPVSANVAPSRAIVDPALSVVAGGERSVIVRAANAAIAARAVHEAGGSVGRSLDIVSGVEARIDAAALERLSRDAAVATISLNGPVRLADATPASAAPNSAYRQAIRADLANAQGLTGAGVTAAIIDTGVSEVPDLAGRIVTVTDDRTGLPAPCVNFSGEPGCQDSYGHGTFVAGVLAGSGASSNGLHAGVAPGARILSVKLSGRDGSADVSGLLAAIQWVVSHRATYGIRIMNLSVGSDSLQSYLVDPLNYAVERAWNAGIVVVVAASNRGPNPATITKPADDPWVITVGAIDDRGTAGASDDVLPNFSARGPTASDSFAKPDVVAPGAHIVSLGAPGSAIEERFPSTIGNGYRRGSGTSFATPATAGAVALLLQTNPSWSPNRVKHALLSTAVPAASSNPFDVGRGLIDVVAARASLPGSANQGLLQSSGLGSLHASRGSLITVLSSDPLGNPIVGNATTAAGLVFSSTEYTGAAWHEAGWQGAAWHGAAWHGTAWHGTAWHGAAWHGAAWHGAAWHSYDGSEPSYGTGYLSSALLGAWE